ncbi:glycosyltransferase family A protein [Metabacillus bambusae]|uniref:Glycosyltransferase family 2 protein n=1 Tax=Metabacillus bambusae TaxID=2795218 RepID=A0ABS3N2A6_9BACI|nr:glycosyltransferase family 2 protein [Metabacillus bambusae]MBO1512354.1 glycosyltransferase family 2 protein [Metabacillus bambusae]
MNKTLTVFTPTYNRAHTLHLCYESLKRQTSKDFVWLIIDDGSNDRTNELVNTWIKENEISIRYHYQENQGMHGAHNTAYELIDTELNVCIDSDDYMSDDAVSKIVEFWGKFGDQKYAGLIGLDATPTGEIIGTKLPENLKAETVSKLHGVHKVKGDKKLVYRSDLTKSTKPYPLFEGEKYCPLSYKSILIDQKHPLLIMNEVLCYVEYLDDGSSMNIINQYKRNPKGFAFFRKIAIQYAPTFKERLRESMHYVSSSLMMGNKKFLFESPRFFTTLMSIPFGVVLYLYITRTSKATVIKS